MRLALPAGTHIRRREPWKQSKGVALAQAVHGLLVIKKYLDVAYR